MAWPWSPSKSLLARFTVSSSQLFLSSASSQTSQGPGHCALLRLGAGWGMGMGAAEMQCIKSRRKDLRGHSPRRSQVQEDWQLLGRSHQKGLRRQWEPWRSGRSETRKSCCPEIWKRLVGPRAFITAWIFRRGLMPWVSEWKGPTVASGQLGRFVL